MTTHYVVSPYDTDNLARYSSKYTSIQSAINGASPNDTIVVVGGHDTNFKKARHDISSVTVSKNLTFIFSNAYVYCTSGTAFNFNPAMNVTMKGSWTLYQPNGATNYTFSFGNACSVNIRGMLLVSLGQNYGFLGSTLPVAGNVMFEHCVIRCDSQYYPNGGFYSLPQAESKYFVASFKNCYIKTNGRVLGNKNSTYDMPMIHLIDTCLDRTTGGTSEDEVLCTSAARQYLYLARCYCVQNFTVAGVNYSNNKETITPDTVNDFSGTEKVLYVNKTMQFVSETKGKYEWATGASMLSQLGRQGADVDYSVASGRAPSSSDGLAGPRRNYPDPDMNAKIFCITSKYFTDNSTYTGSLTKDGTTDYKYSCTSNSANTGDITMNQQLPYAGTIVKYIVTATDEAPSVDNTASISGAMDKTAASSKRSLQFDQHATTPVPAEIDADREVPADSGIQSSTVLTLRGDAI